MRGSCSCVRVGCRRDAPAIGVVGERDRVLLIPVRVHGEVVRVLVLLRGVPVLTGDALSVSTVHLHASG